MRRWTRLSAAGLLTLIIIFELSAFSLLAFRDQALDYSAFIFGGILVVLLLFQYISLTSIFRHLDRYLLIIANLLVAIGLIIQYRINPEIAYRQVIWFGVGMVAMFVCILLMRKPNFFRRMNWVIMIGCVGILLVLLLIGDEQYGAKNWLTIAGQSFQPSELVKVGLVFVLAHWLTKSRAVQEIGRAHV